MANRLSFVFLLTALTSGLVVSACGDDDAVDGGEAGEPGVSGSPGEAGAGGSGVAGSSGGGQGATAGQAPVGGAGEAGAGGVAGSGGSAGNGGEAGAGGAGQAGSPLSEAGAGGAGGSPEPGLTYDCGSATIINKHCSAAVPLNCADQPDCSECVMLRGADRQDLFGECPACLAEYDKSLQCGIDAFEAGNAAAGLECVEGYGADTSEACFPLLDSAIECTTYIFTNPCPAQWPLP